MFQEKLKLVSVMGAGLLVGTALAVIIPEGVHTLYMAQGGKLSTIYLHLIGDNIINILKFSSGAFSMASEGYFLDREYYHTKMEN